jgi:hypothetical protein
MEPWLIQTSILCLVGVVGYLLRQKDVEQAKSIALLFKKHDDDVTRLNDFELRIAQNHYIKPELDTKFNKLETTIKESMDSLGSKFDELSGILLKHLLKGNKDGN